MGAIGRRSVQEGQGRISPLHLWWSHKPAAACRGALLASLLEDTEDAAAREQALELITAAVLAAPGDHAVLDAARTAVLAACGAEPPTVFDPFSGSAAIPAEAQRLGLDVVAADLNPVAVLIAKALLEIPPRFGGHLAVHPGASSAADGRLAGLIADITHYGQRVRAAAHRRIGHHYPTTPEGLPVIVWLWARTLPCPNPACRREMPLVHSFRLSERPGREAWVVPVGDGFQLGPGHDCPPPPEGTVNRRFARCVYCDERIPLTALRPYAQAHAFGQVLLGMVAGAGRGRTYIAADPDQQAAGRQATPTAWAPDTDLPGAALGFAAHHYGLKRHRDLYTPRQLLALTTFADQIRALRPEVEEDARRAGRAADGGPLCEGGEGARAYAEAITVYLALALDRAAAKWCTFARWHRTRDNIEHPFASPGLHMLWDFAEANPFSASTGNWTDAVQAVARALTLAPAHHAPVRPARCVQADATTPPPEAPRGRLLVCTDPPYFDTLPYADMADLFYVWLRPVLRDVYPDLFQTVLTPKAEELVADPHRFGGTAGARAHFLAGMTATFTALRLAADPRYPLSVFYAFKEDSAAAYASGGSGWEVVLTALLAAGLRVMGTWPLRTEHAQRLRNRASNTLASSILLVCRAREAQASTVTRHDWVRALVAELPAAVQALARDGVAPLDLAQAALGPGMATFSRHALVLDGDQPLGVPAALRLIGEVFDTTLTAESGDLDPDSRFCFAWCERHGFEAGPYGEAEMLARAKGVSLDALVRGHMVAAAAGWLRLLRPTEIGPELRAPVGLWAALHAVIAALSSDGLEGATRVCAAWGGSRTELRALAHRLFGLCSARGDGLPAQAYGAAIAALGGHDGRVGVAAPNDAAAVGCPAAH